GPSIDPYLPIAVALPFFVFGPILVGEGRRTINWIIRVVLCATLLLAWAVPFTCGHIVQSRSHWGCDDLMWGYYLYCIAHTVLALYMVMPAIDPKKTVARESSGFPVITKRP